MRVATPLLTLIIAMTMLLACETMPTPTPKPVVKTDSILRFDHVAMAVRDLDTSRRWYRESLGFIPVSEVFDIEVDDSPLGRVATALFGPELKRLRIVQLKTPDGIGIELFEFVDPVPAWPSGLAHTGMLHFAVIAASYDATLSRLERAGAQRIIVNEANPARRTAFFRDPDGNIIQIMSHSSGDG